ncbi:MAG: SCO6745 family protein [Acidimicrobiales bacterium]
MQSIMARKMWRTLEPYHAMIYFSSPATEAYRALGVRGRAGYFASRSAAMGAVSADVVVATFYNFAPGLVRSAIPAAWEAASPAQFQDARRRAADTTLRELLGDEVVGSPEMRAAAELARAAALACTAEGRPLYAGHAGLAWPDEPHMVLWHAVTLLREFRGDGHVTALMLAGLDGCEALVTHAAAGGGILGPDVLKVTRAWPEDEWDAARERLRSRGWLAEDDTLTPAGDDARERVERQTDELAMAPWLALGEELCDQLRAQVRPFSQAIVTGGGVGARPG